MKRCIKLWCPVLLTLGLARVQALHLATNASLPSDSLDIAVTTERPIASTTKKSSNLENHDNSFLNERLPHLTEEEYGNLDEDANPLHFLKHLDHTKMEEHATQPELGKHEEQAKPQEPAKQEKLNQTTAPGSPIYITIPIYINTAGRVPLRLTIGGEEVPLPLHETRRAPSSTTKSPKTSHFNRLLHEIESPKRRQTNRHRSQSRSKIYARKDPNSPVIYKQIG